MAPMMGDVMRDVVGFHEMSIGPKKGPSSRYLPASLGLNSLARFAKGDRGLNTVALFLSRRRRL